MLLSDLKTPAFAVDLAKLERNTARMAATAQRLGVRLRPHVKTHKTVQGALRQLRGGRSGITVSTLAEARAMHAAGFTDITYAVPIAPQKLAEAIALQRAGAEPILLTDDAGAAAALERAAFDAGVRLAVMLKVDCGYHRAGVDPASDAAVALARRLADAPNLELRGILTHAGHAYGARNADEARAIAREERDVMVGFAARLRREGIACPEVSIGSTPTCARLEELDGLAGVSEIRPGNYVFYDRFQADIGSCVLDDCAASVVTRVIGSYPERGQVAIDAGALALSKDAGATHVHAEPTYGYVVGHPELRIEALPQEHGLVRLPAGHRGLAVGTLLRVIPNHSCLAAALFSAYHVVEGERVVDEWRPVRGW
jgi:D-serine deaminase-like pyridoxal phosphate-dependent protein